MHPTLHDGINHACKVFDIPRSKLIGQCREKDNRQKLLDAADAMENDE